MEWWLFVLLIASPAIVYGLARTAGVAWFTAKRNHTRQMLSELSKDDCCKH